MSQKKQKIETEKGHDLQCDSLGMVGAACDCFKNDAIRKRSQEALKSYGSK